jgi:hypothetical protein
MSIDVDIYAPLTCNTERLKAITGSKQLSRDGDLWMACTPMTYFGRGYRRGSWPEIRDLLTRVMAEFPGAFYGGGDYPPAPEAITPQLIADLDALWAEVVERARNTG